MKLKHIFILVFSILSSAFFPQKIIKDSISKGDSLKKHPKIAFDRRLISIDIYDPIYGLFTNKKGAKAQISARIYRKIHVAVEVGYETNSFEDLNWISSAEGIYYKLGFLWFVNHDIENKSNGFHIGAKVANASYQETIDQFPIYGTDSQMSYGYLPAHNENSIWIEFPIGARVQILKTPFYADFMIQPKILLHSSKTLVDPLIIPGFGKNNTGFNLGLFWGVGYAF